MITEAKKYQAFYTESTAIVEYMVSKLSLKPGDAIFEPCGGTGAFVEAILKKNEFARIDIFELNTKSVEILREKFSRYPSINIRECDTLLDSDLNFSSYFGGRYDKIIANPPYGAWQDYSKRTALKKLYPELYIKESYGLFLFRAIQLLKEDGILSFIIPDTFLNLHMHKALRKHLLTNTEIVDLALFPSSFFPGVNFGYANLSIITLRKRSDSRKCMTNRFQIRNGFNAVEELNKPNVSRARTYVFRQEDIFRNTDHAFLLSENSKVSALINNAQTRIGDIADCVTGFYSGNDKRFLQVKSHHLKNGKNYAIANPDSISRNFKYNTELLNGIDGKEHFLPIVKGGNTKYLKPENWYMDWSKEAVHHYKTDKKSRFQNPKYYFKFGIGVPMISSTAITASLIENKLFDQSIVGIFPKDEGLIYYLLAFFNSPTCNTLIRTINPSANNPANYIKKIPIVIPERRILDLITSKTKSIVEAIRETENYDPQLESEIWDMIEALYGI